MNHTTDAMLYAFTAAPQPDIYRPPLTALDVTIPALYQLNKATGGIAGDEMTVEIRVTRGGRTYTGETKLSGKTTQPYTRAIPVAEVVEVRL